MLKTLYIQIVSFIITHQNFSEKIRDFLIWPLASRVLGANYTKIIQLRAGFFIHAYMEDHLGRLAIFYGSNYRYFWEPGTTQLLERLVIEAKQVIIAGSHIGLTALYARKAIPNTSDTCVHTFEPITHLFNIAQKNFDSNKNIGKIQFTKAALGNINTSVTMTDDRIRSRIIENINSPKGEATEHVPVITIDTYCKENEIKSVDVVLLDVEGYEYNALTGMQHQLETNPPKDIIYEISFPKKDDLAAAIMIEKYLSSFGYEFYIIEDSSDPLEMTNKGNPYMTELTPATKARYLAHINHRYFNMYATQRKISEVEKVAYILNS